MKIIQQPDILSFAGNMNDFVIEDVAKSLVFKLSVDGMVIVDEVYVAEGGAGIDERYCGLFFINIDSTG